MFNIFSSFSVFHILTLTWKQLTLLTNNMYDVSNDGDVISEKLCHNLK